MVTSQMYTPASEMWTKDETLYIAEVATNMSSLFHL